MTNLKDALASLKEKILNAKTDYENTKKKHCGCKESGGISSEGISDIGSETS